MPRDFPIAQITISKAILEGSDQRLVNQFVGCAHAHNELAFFNKILMFSITNQDQENLYKSAHAIQQWSSLQILSAKLVETWRMIEDRILKIKPLDPAIAALGEGEKASLDIVKAYFLSKGNPLVTIRDKTAYHYDKLNLTTVFETMPEDECKLYLAPHRANSLYYVGSALVFRAIFSKIAIESPKEFQDGDADRIARGFRITADDAAIINLHLHNLLYGLIRVLIEKLMGCAVEDLDWQRYNISDAVDPDDVILHPFVDF